MQSPLKQDAYDIIICGGGTAGCVLAARLTEDPDLQVLMIEAGGNANQDPQITTPGMFATLADHPGRNWGFMSEPNTGLNDRMLPYPRGKCIGGSSAINLMALIYPSELGLNTWAELGNTGWDWKSMAPYFRKFQTHVLPPEEIREALGINYLDEEYTGTDGPIQATYPQTLDPLQKAWVDTWKTLKRSGQSPLNGTGVGGFTTPASVNLKTGQRSFAGLEYFAPVSSRSNSSSGAVRAIGVVFSVDGKKHTANARCEVLLSTGVIGSPQILELSGIGSPALCKTHGIPTVIDNPHVGENLQDHMLCSISVEVADGVVTADMTRDPAFLKVAIEQYQQTRTGPLATGGGYSFAYTPLVDCLGTEPKESIEALLNQHMPTAPTSASPSPRFEAEQLAYAFNRKVILSPDETSAAMAMSAVQIHAGRSRLSDILAVTEPENYVSIVAQLSHPFSRGSVHIKSADPAVAPTIAPNALSHPLDLEIFARHVMQCEVLTTVPPLSDFVKPGGRHLPDGHHARTLDAAKELVKNHTSSFYHPCGTCAMLPEALGGVVNERLVVHGTSNLRVIDASIFPIEPRGNLQSTVYATAEKGADMIKEDLQRSKGK